MPSWGKTRSPLLSPDSSLVERQLVTLKNVTIATPTLTGTTRNDRVQPTRLKLPLQALLNFAHLVQALFPLVLHALANLLILNSFLALDLSPPPHADAVVCFVPLSEGRGVDLDDGGFCEGVGADEFVVEAQGAVFGVAAADADEMDSLVANSCVGWLTTFLKGSVMPRLVEDGYGSIEG